MSELGTKWISAAELLAQGVKDFELIDYIRKGLEPFDHKGDPIPENIRPMNLTCYPEDNSKNPETTNERSNKISKEVETLERLKDYPWIRHPYDAKDLNNLRSVKYSVLSWKYLDKRILSHHKRDTFLQWLSTANFKKDDVDRIIHGQDVEEPPKKLRNEQRHRERCRAVAEMLWKEDRNRTIVDIAEESDEIKEIGCEVGRGGRKYDVDTIRKWIKDLNPNEGKPGRPKKDK